MTSINLLPWRETQRQQEKKKKLFMAVAVVIVAAVVVVSMNAYVGCLIDNQTERNLLLQEEIKTLDDQIKEINSLKKVKQRLISRMSMMHKVQSTRNLLVHLVDELIQVLPEGVFLYKLERKEDLVTVWGYAESNTTISMLMRAIEVNPWIQAPILTQIKTMDDSKLAATNEFSLSFLLKSHHSIVR